MRVYLSASMATYFYFFIFWGGGSIDTRQVCRCMQPRTNWSETGRHDQSSSNTVRNLKQFKTIVHEKIFRIPSNWKKKTLNLTVNAKQTKFRIKGTCRIDQFRPKKITKIVLIFFKKNVYLLYNWCVIDSLAPLMGIHAQNPIQNTKIYR